MTHGKHFIIKRKYSAQNARVLIKKHLKSALKVLLLLRRGKTTLGNIVNIVRSSFFDLHSITLTILCENVELAWKVCLGQA